MSSSSSCYHSERQLKGTVMSFHQKIEKKPFFETEIYQAWNFTLALPLHEKKLIEMIKYWKSWSYLLRTPLKFNK